MASFCDNTLFSGGDNLRKKLVKRLCRMSAKVRLLAVERRRRPRGEGVVPVRYGNRHHPGIQPRSKRPDVSRVLRRVNRIDNRWRDSLCPRMKRATVNVDVAHMTPSLPHATYTLNIA